MRRARRRRGRLPEGRHAPQGAARARRQAPIARPGARAAARACAPDGGGDAHRPPAPAAAAAHVLHRLRLPAGQVRRLGRGAGADRRLALLQDVPAVPQPPPAAVQSGAGVRARVRLCAVHVRTAGAAEAQLRRPAARRRRAPEVRDGGFRVCAARDARRVRGRDARPRHAATGATARQPAERVDGRARPDASRRRRRPRRHLHPRRALRAAAVGRAVLQRARLSVGADRGQRQLLTPAHTLHHLQAARRQHAPPGGASQALARHRVRAEGATDNADQADPQRVPVRQGDPQGTAAER